MSTTLDPALAEAQKMYFEECAELLDDAASRLTAMADTLDTTKSEDINAVFRAIHSAKGGGGAWGLTVLTEFAHALETVLEGVRSHKIPITPEVTSVLIEGNDVLLMLLQEAAQGISSDPEVSGQIKDQLVKIAGSADKADPGKASVDEHKTEFVLSPILDNANVMEVKKALQTAIANEKNVVISGREVERVTTLGLQVLVSAAKQVSERGGQLTIDKPSAVLSESMESLGLTEFLSSHH